MLAILAAFAMHVAELNEIQMGREAYLAKMAGRFDRHAAHPTSMVGIVIACLIIYGIGVVVYELIAFGIRKMLERLHPDGSNS